MLIAVITIANAIRDKIEASITPSSETEINIALDAFSWQIHEKVNSDKLVKTLDKVVDQLSQDLSEIEERLFHNEKPFEKPQEEYDLIFRYGTLRGAYSLAYLLKDTLERGNDREAAPVEEWQDLENLHAQLVTHGDKLYSDDFPIPIEVIRKPPVL